MCLIDGGRKEDERTQYNLDTALSIAPHTLTLSDAIKQEPFPGSTPERTARIFGSSAVTDIQSQFRKDEENPWELFAR